MLRWLIEAMIEAVLMLRFSVKVGCRWRMSLQVARIPIPCAGATTSRIVGIMVCCRACIASDFVLVLSRVAIVTIISVERIVAVLLAIIPG